MSIEQGLSHSPIESDQPVTQIQNDLRDRLSTLSPECEYSQEMVNAAGVQILTANWGIPTETAEIVKRYRDKVPAERLAASDKIGFKGGWKYPPGTGVASDQVQSLHVALSANLLLQAFNNRGWDHLDALAVASITSSPDITKSINKRLEAYGMGIDKGIFYGMACAGGLAALTDLAMDPALEGKKVGVLAIDSMGAHADPGPDGYLDHLIFGNGAGIATFVPGRDVRIEAAQTDIHDDKSIVFPISWEGILTPENRGKQYNIPGHYHIDDTDPARTSFTYTDEVRMVHLHTNTSDFLRMRAREVYKYVTRAVRARMENFFQEHPRFCSMNFARTIMHQPSQQVVTGLVESWKGMIPDIHMGWDIGPTGTNNASAATIFRHMAQLAKNGEIKRGIPTTLLGFGIGADVIAVAVF